MKMPSKCQHPSENHSENIIEIWHGCLDPLILCGYHQAMNLTKFPCIVPNCKEEIEICIWHTEFGFCVEHSNAYFNQELDPLTLERIAQ